MIIYLDGHSRLDIFYAVNCAARNILCPKHSHELAIKIIGQKLKVARDIGLVINSPTEIKIDFYHDADFFVMYGN